MKKSNFGNMNIFSSLKFQTFSYKKFLNVNFSVLNACQCLLYFSMKHQKPSLKAKEKP